MAFLKIGRAESIGYGTIGTGEGLVRVADTRRRAAPSYYLDGAVSLDVRKALKEASTKYAISADPADYVFEAIRACTTNAPNDNHDGFHRSEKLRFIPQLRMAVYQTFAGKPHHVDHRCFVDGTPVVMADGSSRPIEQVKVGDKVLDRTGRVQTVTDAWDEGVPTHLTRVALKGYGELFSTSHHNFPVWAWPRLCGCGCGCDVKPGKAFLPDHYKGGRTTSVLAAVDGSEARHGGLRRIPLDYNPRQRLEAGQIQKDDYLFVPVVRPDNAATCPVSQDQARLLGYYVAEGCSDSYKSTRWCFGAHEVETWVADVEQVCASLNVTTRRSPVDRGACAVRSIGSASHGLHAWLVEHGGAYAHEKALSPAVMTWPTAAKRELICGMFRGDGSQHYARYTTKSGRRHAKFIVAYTTVSAKLAAQVRLLLIELGISSTFEENTANVADGDRARFIIRTTGAFARDLAKLVWGETALGQEIVDSTAANKVKREGDEILVPVKSVETVPNTAGRHVRNLTVSGDHSYLVGPGIATFNTENPKAARGVILDAAYNDESPALVTCPTAGCETRTADRQNRDGSGLHCKRCGALVKDEFTEILVGVDGHKDAFFADNVRNGTLNKGSMGCNCGNTSCNVCKHVAFSKSEFCSHIRGSSKGTYWLRHEGAAGQDPWVKVSFDEAKRLAAQRGFGIVEPDFCYIKLEPGDMGSAFGARRRGAPLPERERRQAFEVRKAFEYCADVVYDEYSRVPTPADPKALQREILRAAAARSPGMRRAASRLPAPDELRRESELLVREAQRYEEPAMSRAASAHEPRTADAGDFAPEDGGGDGGGGGQRFVVVRVDGDDLDTYVGSSLEEALGLAMPEPGSAVEYTEVEAQDAGAARNGLDGAAWAPVPDEMLQGMDAEGVVVIPDGKPDVTIQNAPGEGAPGEAPPGAELDPNLPGGPAAPGAQPGPPGAPVPPGGGGPGIGPYTDQQIDEPGAGPGAPGAGMGAQRQMTAPEVGILPPGVRASHQPRPGAAMNAPAPRPQSPGPARGVVAARGPFAPAYSAWAVDVSEAGSARLSAPDGTPVAVFPARAGVARTAANHVKVGQQIMASLLETGLLRTINAHAGVISPRIAGVVDGATNDMQSYQDHEQYGSILEGEEHDFAGDRGTPSDSVLSEHTHDMQLGLGKPPKSVTESATADHEINRTPPTGVADQDPAMMRDKRKPPNVGRDSILDGETHDHQVSLTSRSGAKGELGERVAHREHGGEWTVMRAHLRADRGVDLDITGAFPNGNAETRRIAKTDLAKFWASLDGPLPGTAPVGAPRGRTADLEKCAECGGKMVAGKCAACDAKGKEAGARTASAGGAASPGPGADHAQRWAASQVRKAKDEAAASTAAAVEAAVGVFRRALRVAARRQFVDLEESPLRQAALAVLGQPHVVGTDAATGQALAVDPPDPQVARHLVASILADGYQADIERVLARAAALSEKGEAFLVEAEKDLENIRPSMPEVVATAAPPVGHDDAGHRAAAMRNEASRGFTRVGRQGRPPLVDPGEGGYRGRIASAVGGMNGTRTGHLLARLTPPNGVPH